MPGLLITFEGIDYSGKSLQCRMFYERLQLMKKEVIPLRDPGANPISEKIRAILLDKALPEMFAVTELLLYESARSQMVEQQIKPALAQGAIVVCDRFYDSTTAYQGFGRGLDTDIVCQANRIGSCGITPNHTFLLDVDPQTALQRKRASGRESDRIEQEGVSFQTQVRSGYIKIANMEPKRISIIEAGGSAETIHRQIWDIFTGLFKF